jgi:hypothetical protein
MLKASVREDLRKQELLISVQTSPDTAEWVTFTDRPAKAVCQCEDYCDGDDDSHLYQVVLEDGRVVIADSIDIEFEGAN